MGNPLFHWVIAMSLGYVPVIQLMHFVVDIWGIHPMVLFFLGFPFIVRRIQEVLPLNLALTILIDLNSGTRDKFFKIQLCNY